MVKTETNKDNMNKDSNLGIKHYLWFDMKRVMNDQKQLFISILNYKYICKLNGKLNKCTWRKYLILTQTGFQRKNVRTVLLCITSMTLLAFIDLRVYHWFCIQLQNNKTTNYLHDIHRIYVRNYKNDNILIVCQLNGLFLIMYKKIT